MPMVYFAIHILYVNCLYKHTIQSAFMQASQQAIVRKKLAEICKNQLMLSCIK